MADPTVPGVADATAPAAPRNASPAPPDGGPWRWSRELGDHRIELEVDGADARLYLDGVVRKARRRVAGRAYLWTNVELPFEDHHLVEVRLAPAGDGTTAVRISIRGSDVFTAVVPVPGAVTAP